MNQCPWYAVNNFSIAEGISFLIIYLHAIYIEHPRLSHIEQLVMLLTLVMACASIVCWYSFKLLFAFILIFMCVVFILFVFEAFASTVFVFLILYFRLRNAPLFVSIIFIFFDLQYEHSSRLIATTVNSTLYLFL